MDLLDDFRATRKLIVEKNRPELDAKLGMFPLDQKEALPTSGGVAQIDGTGKDPPSQAVAGGF